MGRVIAELAVAAGWRVTVLNRGSRPPPAGARQIVGDRTDHAGLAAALDAAVTRSVDCVVDTWSGPPSAVALAAEHLAADVDRYVYISSRSVYAWPPPAGAEESAPLVEGIDPDGGEGVDYPRAKAGGEAAVVRAMGAERSLLARCGLILGPGSDIGRLPWWLQRAARGGPMVAPGPPDLPLQFVDVRDVAAWVLQAIADHRSGPFDVVSHPGHATMRSLLEACIAVTGSDARLVWADPDAVLDAGVAPWTQLPIWLPPGEMADAMHRSDPTKVHRAGLVCRPVEETVADTWAWQVLRAAEVQVKDGAPPVGLDPQEEAALLRRLAAAQDDPEVP